MKPFQRNFVRLCGTIEKVESSASGKHEIDHILIRAENDSLVWLTCDFKRSPQLFFRRDLWQRGMKIVALGLLEADGDIVYVMVTGLFTENDYQDEMVRRAAERKRGR